MESMNFAGARGVPIKDRPSFHFAYGAITRAFDTLGELYGLKPQENRPVTHNQWPAQFLQLPIGKIMLTKRDLDVDLAFQTVLVDGRFISVPDDKIEIRYAVSNEYRQVQKRFLNWESNPVAKEILNFWRKQTYSTDTQKWELLCFKTAPNERSANDISDFIARHVPK